MRSCAKEFGMKRKPVEKHGCASAPTLAACTTILGGIVPRCSLSVAASLEAVMQKAGRRRVWAGHFTWRWGAAAPERWADAGQPGAARTWNAAVRSGYRPSSTPARRALLNGVLEQVAGRWSNEAALEGRPVRGGQEDREARRKDAAVRLRDSGRWAQFLPEGDERGADSRRKKNKK